MSYTKQELYTMTLQRLAYVMPQNAEDEKLLQEIFELRAAVSTYQTLTAIDVRQGWQEDILQKYVDEKRETMARENPATLNGEDQAALDSNVITKEKELELQAKLDEKNKIKKEESTADETEIPAIAEQIAANYETVEPVVETPGKKTKKAKK